MMKAKELLDPDFKQKPVILVKDEEKLRFMGNPTYYPILMSLREGYKTVKEIEEDYSKFIVKDLKKQGITDEKEIKEILKKKTRSDKSLYRYIQHLIDADFVVLMGKRISKGTEKEKPVTENLFARTAKFFFIDSYKKDKVSAHPECIKSTAQLLEIIYGVPQPNMSEIEQFTNLVNESSKKITSLLFNEKSEEFVEIVDNLSLDEVNAVLKTINLIDLIHSAEKTSKLIESLKK